MRPNGWSASASAMTIAGAAAAGAAPQAWHADGPHLFGGDAAEAVPSLPAHALTVFLPLADVTEAVRCIAHAQRTARRHTAHAAGATSVELMPLV